jgi:hypothetical protein
MLLDLFSGARFIHVYRCPCDVFASTVHLHERMLPITTLQRIPRHHQSDAIPEPAADRAAATGYEPTRTVPAPDPGDRRRRRPAAIAMAMPPLHGTGNCSGREHHLANIASLVNEPMRVRGTLEWKLAADDRLQPAGLELAQ